MIETKLVFVCYISQIPYVLQIYFNMNYSHSILFYTVENYKSNKHTLCEQRKSLCQTPSCLFQDKIHCLISGCPPLPHSHPVPYRRQNNSNQISSMSTVSLETAKR